MPVQFLGWRPDQRPAFKNADTARMQVQLQEQEMNDRRKALEQSLEEQQFQREMQMFDAERNIWRDQMLEEGRNTRSADVMDRTALLEEGRDTRASASQERLITGSEQKAARDWFQQATTQDRQAAMDNPEFARIITDAYSGVAPGVERYEKPPKMSGSDLDKRMEIIDARLEDELTKYNDREKAWVWGGVNLPFDSDAEKKWKEGRQQLIDEAGQAKRDLSKIFDTQFNEITGKGTTNTKYPMGSTHIKGGKTFVVVGYDVDGEPKMELLGADRAEKSEPAGEKRKTGADREKRNIFRVEE